MTHHMRVSTIAITTCLGLSSCGLKSVPDPIEQMDLPAPQAWSAASSGHQGKISTGWLKEFKTPQLESVVHQALANNHDLQVAAARMREARSSSIIAGAPLRPSASFSANSSVTDGLNNLSRSNHSLNLSVAWEVDLWGRLRNRRNQALANEQAVVNDYRGARLSLAANTAKAWCNVVSANQEVTLAEATLESFEKNLRIIERNYKGTGEGALDIQFGRNNVSSARRTLESRKLDRDESARSLELLLGRYPDATLLLGSKLPQINHHVPGGLPADLIERRPDLCAERARLLASVEAAHAARKALLPAITLTANSGNSSESFSDLLDLNSLIHTLTARLTQTLTEGGAITAAAQAAVERNRAQVHSYAQSALTAFREVESALAADSSLATQQVFLAEELKQAALAENQAERNYTEGINPNILSVLEAQRRANNARASVIRLQNLRIQNRIDLHLALGGDFDTPQP